MALLNLIGFETGNLRESITGSGTQSQAAAAARTGDYGQRCNPTTTAVGFYQYGGIRATIGDANAAGINIATLFRSGAFRITTLPAANGAGRTNGPNPTYIPLTAGLSVRGVTGLADASDAALTTAEVLVNVYWSI